MEEKIEIKGKETIVCRMDNNSNLVYCDVYKEGELTKTFAIPRERLKDLFGD